MAIDEESAGQRWERQAGERSLWYARFCIFRDMGPERTIRGAWTRWGEGQNDTKQNRNQNRSTRTTSARTSTDTRGTPGAWRRAATRFEWVQRAEAYDSYLDGLAIAAVALAFRNVRNAAPDAVAVLVGLLADADQKRHAANSILNRAGVGWNGGVPDERGQTAIKVVEVVQT